MTQPGLPRLVREHGRGAALFSAFGLVNSVTDLAVFSVAVLLGVNAAAANGLAFLVANLQSYFLNGKVTFRQSGQSARLSVSGYAKFCSAHLIGLAVSTLVILTLAERVGPFGAKGVAVLASVGFNYAMSAMLVFRTPKNEGSESR